MVAAAMLVAGAVPGEAQQLAAGAAATRYHQDSAGTLFGYAIDVRSGARGIVVALRAATGSDASQRVFCGSMVPPGTACPLEPSDVHTRARTIAVGYALPIASAFDWTGAAVPELSWAFVQSRETGRQTGSRLDFEEGLLQVGLGLELSRPALLLDRVGFRLGGHAYLPRVPQEDCVDCILPRFHGVGYTSSLTVALTYSF